MVRLPYILGNVECVLALRGSLLHWRRWYRAQGTGGGACPNSKLICLWRELLPRRRRRGGQETLSKVQPFEEYRLGRVNYEYAFSGSHNFEQ